MNKRDELLKGQANIRESMGDFAAVRGAPPVGPRATPAHLVGVVRSKDVSDINIDRIIPDPEQPRKEFDEEALAKLSESMKARGQLQPIRVRWDEGRGVYVILCGERRWKAAPAAGLKTLACVIEAEDLSPHERLAVQLIENALREDLRPIEQARAYLALIEAQGWSARQLAAELSIHHAQVVRALKLLKLPPAIQEMVEREEMTPAAAYEVSKLDDPDAQQEVARRIVAEDLSRAEAIEAVREIAVQPAQSKARAKGRGAKAKARKVVTSRTLRTTAGYKLTAEHRRGVEPEGLLAALDEAAAVVRAEIEAKSRGEAA